MFSHMDDPEEDESMQVDTGSVVSQFKDDKPGFYQLHGFITHLGASVHAGHYVCHLKRQGKWIYFNDAKVAQTDQPPIGKGYMYFLKKVDQQ